MKKTCKQILIIMRMSIVLLIVLILQAKVIYAQNLVTGTVTSSTGEPLPGVNVTIKGTTVGVMTDMNGSFTITPSNSQSVLMFSFIGFEPQEVTVGSQTRLNVTLAESMQMMEEVVVTALGIQREAKTLTYSSQQVSGAEMMKAKDINFMNSLSGKTAGLEINKAASGAGGSTKTVLRGAKSFSGDSSPLYVIDGVPIVNRVGGQASLWGGTDEGDGISGLNPDDIESISVLKGANAAILYGSQGANGVIMITTKKGTAGAVDVSIGSATTFENVLVWPELQYKYGAVDGVKETWSYTPHNDPKGYKDQDLKDFFQTGYNLVNNITISGGGARTTAYFSYANTAARGITPENTYLKHNLSLRQSTKLLNDKISVGTNLMLTSEIRNNAPRAGYTHNPLTALYWFPRERNISDFRDGNNWYQENVERNIDEMNWFVDDHFQSNPWWLIHKHTREDIGKRMIASANVTWDITSKLKFTVKGNYDYANRLRDSRMYAGGNLVGVGPNGSWSFSQYVDWLAYVDGILSYSNSFGDFSLTAVAGGSTQETRYGTGVSANSGSTENSMYLPNEFLFQNLHQQVMVNSTLSSRAIKQGLFANATIGFKEMIFIDLSGRNDWSSTLALTGNDSYFYPAVGLSAIASQIISLPDFITFGKVRGSYTTVANDVAFDAIVPRTTIDGAAITSTSAAVTTPTRPAFYDAKPEMLTSIEAGTDWRFLEGRLGFDFTWYHITSSNQFLLVPTLQGLGFSNKYMNVGEIVNKGIELMIDAEPVAIGDFSWRTSFNFSRNRNKIVEVNPDDPEQRISLGDQAGYYSWIQKGGSFGDIYSLGFVYDDQGRIMVDETHKPLKTQEPEYRGRSTPDFTLGWNNSFSYKRWSMGFLIHGVFGGVVVSQTEAMLDGYGASKRTGDARDKGHVDVNAIVEAPAADNHGDIVTEIDPYTWYRTTGERDGIVENYIYDRTNIRLTQFSLNYDIPVRALDLPIKSASVGLIGQNLFFFYKKAPYDPELTMSAGTSNQALDNFNLPSTRTYGFNIKVNF